jgi:hypothetical protein
VAANGLKQHAARDQLGDQLRTKLNWLAGVTESLHSEVETVQQFVFLDVGRPKAAAPDFASLSTDELVEASELLRAIYRAGVTIKAHETFSDAE